MNEIMQKIAEWFIGTPFTRNNIDVIRAEIKDLIYRKYPSIEREAYVKGHEIHIPEVIIKDDREIISYLPYILDLKEGFFYDLYIGLSANYQVAYEEMIDYSEGNYGYTAQIRQINKEMPKIDIVFEVSEN